MLFGKNWPLSLTVSFVNHNCTHSAAQEWILQGLSPLGMGPSFSIDMSGTRKATLSRKEFYAHYAAFHWAAEEYHSMGTTFPQIPDLI